jgi:hypothetical protein
MFLTITTTHHPANDLGYLLRKNPARRHTFELSFGRTHVSYISPPQTWTFTSVRAVDGGVEPKWGGEPPAGGAVGAGSDVTCC